MVNLPEVNVPHYWYNNMMFNSREAALDAMLLNNDFNSTMEFRLGEYVYDKIDWTQRIEYSLSTLYKMRAQQIRDKYAYLIVNFSGGSDSTQMLYSFINNNIFIDEILMINYERIADGLSKDEYMKDKELQQLLEYKLAAKPILEYVKKVSPKTKISIVDASDFVVDQFTSLSKYHVVVGRDKDLESTSPRLFTARPQVYSYYTNLHILEKGKLDKSTCLVRGFEKPIMIINDLNEVITLFSDVVMVSRRTNQFSIEDFYWSPELPYITVKQSQLIKNELQTNKEFYERFYSSKQKIQAHTDVFTHSPAYMIERELSRIIYPDFNLRTFAAPKTIWIPGEVKALKKLGLTTHTNDVVKDNANYKLNYYKNIVNKKQFHETLYTKGYFVGMFRPKWS